MAISAAHAQIAKILEMDKEAHWLENANLSPDEIQRLWVVRSAPLAAVLGTEAPTQRVDLNTNQPVVPQDTLNTPPPTTVQDARRRNSVRLQEPPSQPYANLVPGRSSRSR